MRWPHDKLYRARQADKKTPAHAAAIRGSEKVLRRLIEMGADLDAKDAVRGLPWPTYAAAACCPCCCRLMCVHVLMLSSRSRSVLQHVAVRVDQQTGKTPLDCAKSREHADEGDKAACCAMIEAALSKTG